MSESKFLAVMDAIDWYGCAVNHAREKQQSEFRFQRVSEAGGGNQSPDWSISPVRLAYAAFLESLRASGFELRPVEPATPSGGESR